MFKFTIKSIVFLICALLLGTSFQLKAQSQNQSIVISAVFTKTYYFSNEEIDLSSYISASSGLPVTYQSDNTSIATIVDGKIKPVGVGTFNLIVSQPGNATYLPAPNYVTQITFVKANQTISFPEIPAKSLSSPDFSPGATTDSDLPLTYESSNTNVAVIVGGNMIQIVGRGTSQITASQAGNSNYFAATSVVKTLNVSANTQTITFNPITKTYLDPNFQISATASSRLAISSYTSSNPAVATILSNNTVKINGVGTTTLTATQNGNSTYQSATATTTLTVNKANQTINLGASATVQFGTADFTPVAVVSSGLTPVYSSSDATVATIVGGKVHLTGVGQTTISANQSGDGNYNAANQVNQILVVSKGNQTITFPNILAKALGSPNFDPLATSNSGLAVTYTSNNNAVAEIDNNEIKIIGVGTATITAQQAGNANYNAADPVSRTITISNSIQTILFPAIPNKTFGDADFSPGATATSGLGLTYTSSDLNVAKIVNNLIQIVGGGTTTITATQAGNSTYASVSASTTLTVNKKAQTINFAALSQKLRSDADFTLQGESNSNLALTYTSSNPSIAQINGNTVKLMGAGTVDITAAQAGNAQYSTATPVIRSLEVLKGNQSLTFPPISEKTLLDVEFYPGAYSNSGLNIVYTSSNTAVATISGNKVVIVAPGNTVIKATQAGDANWNSNFIERTLNVVSKHNSINFPVVPNIALNDPDYDLQITSSSGLTVDITSSDPSIATVVGGKLKPVAIGTVIITASQNGNGVYDAARTITREVKIVKSQQTITFPIIPNKKIGDADFSTGATINSGLPITYKVSNTDVVTVVGGMIKVIGVGTSNITASQEGDVTYSAAKSVTRSITVTGNGVQAITFPAQPDLAYSTALYNPGAISNAGLAVTYTVDNDAVATANGGTIKLVGVGTVNITATQAGNDSFGPATATASLNVIKGTSQIVFNPLSNRQMNAADFSPNATSVNNLPITYTSSDLSVAEIENDKISLRGIGTTTITASHAGNSLFNSFTISQPLTVTRGVQTITFPLIEAKNPSNPDFSPNATSNSGLPVEYTSSNLAVATIVGGNQIHIVGIGTTEITASQPGNANFSAATPIKRTLVVSKSSQTITFPAIRAQALNAPSFDPNATTTSGLPITLVSSNPSVASVTGTIITVHAVGSTNITASQAGNVSYNAANSVTRVLNVSDKVQILTAPATVTKEYGSPDFELNVTSNAGLTPTLTSSDHSVAIILNGKIRLTGVGTTVITSTQLGNSQYTGTTALTTLTVTKTNQTITFPALPIKKVGDPSFVIGGSSSSGLSIFYTSDNTSIARIIGNRIEIVGVGTANIIASHPGDDNYFRATDVSRSFTVTKGTQVINFPDFPSKSITDVDFPHGITVNSGLPLTLTSSNPSVATIVGNNIHIVGMGNTTITATQAGNPSYEPATPVSKTLTIKGYAQIMTFNPIADKQLGDPDFDPAATVNTGLPITYSSSNTNVAIIVNGKVRIVGGGTTTITASQEGDATYASISVSHTFSVPFEAQTISFPEISAKPIGTADFNPGATSSSGLAISYESSNTAVATVVDGKIHIVGIGTTIITATQPGNAKFGPATPVERTLNVTNGVQTITFPTIGVKYHTDAAFELEATATSGLPITYSSSNTDVATINGNMVQIKSPGNTTITANQIGNENFAAAVPVAQNLTVLFSIPNNNFGIKVTDVACKGNTNGIITITAVQNLGYSVNITGQGKNINQNFNTSTSVANLGAGTYKVTITISGVSNYSQSYDVTIKEPKDLAAFATVKESEKEVVIKLDGASTYNIDVNGRVYTTSNNEITLPLSKGNNIVKISSDKICQGIIEQSIFLNNSISLYPNPVIDELNINTGKIDNKSVKIDIFGLDGRLVFSKALTPSYGVVKINLNQLNKGVYVLNLTIGTEKTVHKVVKN